MADRRAYVTFMEVQTGFDGECTLVDELLDDFNQEVEDKAMEKRKRANKNSNKNINWFDQMNSSDYKHLILIDPEI